MTKCLRYWGGGLLYDRKGTGDNNYNKIQSGKRLLTQNSKAQEPWVDDTDKDRITNII